MGAAVENVVSRESLANPKALDEIAEHFSWFPLYGGDETAGSP
jgi:hypothetical protein